MKVVDQYISEFKESDPYRKALYLWAICNQSKDATISKYTESNYDDRIDLFVESNQVDLLDHIKLHFFVVTDTNMHDYLSEIENCLVTKLRPFQYLITVSLSSTIKHTGFMKDLFRLLEDIYVNGSDKYESVTTINFSESKSSFVYLDDLNKLRDIYDISDDDFEELRHKHEYRTYYIVCSRGIARILKSKCPISTTKRIMNIDSCEEFVMPEEHTNWTPKMTQKFTDFCEYCEELFIQHTVSGDLSPATAYRMLPDVVAVDLVLTDSLNNWDEIRKSSLTSDLDLTKIFDFILENQSK